MNAGQEKFMGFILGNVKEERLEDARALLSESFAKQADGSFDLEYLKVFDSKMMDMVKAESKEQVREVFEKFKENFR